MTNKNVATVYKAIERGDIAIPLQNILDENGEITVLSEVQAHGYFDIRFRKNQLHLTAGNYIGQIPLNDSVIIDVRPKVPIKNLVNLIGKSGHDVKLFDFYTRTYAGLERPPKNIFEFLCRCLSLELRWIVKEGVYREYVQFEQSTSMLKGRLLFERTIRNRWSKGQTHLLEVSFFQLTLDTPLNRLIKYTLWYCLRHMQAVGGFDNRLLRELSLFYGMFTTVTLDKSRTFVEPVLLILAEERLPIIRHYYQNIEKVCLAIIENVGMDMMRQGRDYEAASFIINMADVFEGYVLYIAKRAALEYGHSIRVLDGNAEGKRYLFRDSKRFEAKPDITFEHGTSVLLVLDSKYKNKLVESDRYQIIAHALAYNANIAIHVLPGTALSAGLEYIGTVGNRAPIKLYSYRLDIESETLDRAEEAFCKLIAGILADRDSVGAAA